MGYQESLIRVNNAKDFDFLVYYLDRYEKMLSSRMNIDLATVVTLKKDITVSLSYMLKPDEIIDLHKGEKLVCITGERYCQNKELIFNEIPRFRENVNVYEIEYFPYEKMFGAVNNELASEIEFKDYVKKNKVQEKFKDSNVLDQYKENLVVKMKNVIHNELSL